MHDIAVRVGLVDWREALLNVADTRLLRHVELPGDLLAADPGDVLRLIQHLGLSILHVADAIPATLSRYASEAGLAETETGLASLAHGVRARLKGGVRFTSLDVGLDRLAAEPFVEGMRRRVHLIRHLLHELELTGVNLAVRVRMPRPFVGSHEWEWAGNLLHELTAEPCALAIDVAMPDLPEDFDANTLLRGCATHLALLRFHFRWGWGESPAADVWSHWSSALRRHPGRLGVVFCPHGPGPAAAPLVLAYIERWVAPLVGDALRPPLRTAVATGAARPPPGRNPG